MTIIHTILMHVIYSIVCPPIHSWLLSIVALSAEPRITSAYQRVLCWKFFKMMTRGASNQPRVEQRLDDLPKCPLRGLFLSQFRGIVCFGKAKSEFVYQCKILIGLQSVQLKQYIVVGILEFQSCIQMFLVG